MSNNVLFAVSAQGVATITLNRPEVHNAFDDALVKELIKILHTIHHDPKIRVAVLAAEGKSFSAGADLNWMRSMASYTYEENIRDALALSDLMQALKFLNKPTIARVQGAAFGGGVGLVACCDMAIVSMQANFCLSEVKIGLIPAVISPYVISAIGERAARRYFLTAEQINATDAFRLGLATEVVAEDELDNAVQKIINSLLYNSPQAVSAAKDLINRISAAAPYDQAQLQKNAEMIAALRVSKEGQEGLSAFLEKRKLTWHNK